MLDLVAADFLDFANVQKAHIDIALNHFGGQHVTYLAQLKLRIRIRGQIALFLFDAGIAPLEIETSGNFLVGLIDCIFDFDYIGFRYNIKRWHDSFSFDRTYSSGGHCY